MRPSIIVIGGGTVGAAIAYGLARRNEAVLLLDGDDGDFRAARANFGLVWLQGKGLGMPEYQSLTRQSIARWRAFCNELETETGRTLSYQDDGGLAFCLGEQAYEDRRLALMRLDNQRSDGDPAWEMLERAPLERLLGNVTLGPRVVGASYGRTDGHVNPLLLLAALHAGIQRLGGSIRHNARVERIEPDGSGFRLKIAGETLTVPRIVIAAGLGSQQLAQQVGLQVPVRPQRGQVLVTERIEPLLRLPASGLRQTDEGTIMIGATQENCGFDVSTMVEGAATLCAKSVEIFPALASVKLVRHWAGLRVLTPDSYPVYAQSEAHPGAFVALCHSGVTLAAYHADVLAEAVAQGALPAALSPFHQRRFDVSKAA